MVTWCGFITPYLFVGRVSWLGIVEGGYCLLCRAASSCDNDSVLILSAVWEPSNDQIDMVNVNVKVGMRGNNHRTSQLKINEKRI